jgi:hypothetical protein
VEFSSLKSEANNLDRDGDSEWADGGGGGGGGINKYPCHLT